MTDDGEERLVAEIPENLKRLVDADERTNKDVVEAALWREFGGERLAPLDRRIEEKKRRLSMLESERNERERELDEEEDELQALKRKRERLEEQKVQESDQLEEAIERLSDAPRDPENPAIKTQASKLDMTPEELLEELPDRDSGGLSSL